MPENWELVFQHYLARCALAVAAELKDVDPNAEARGRSFALLAGAAYCPECWVRYGRAIKLRQRRWLVTCDEHDYKLPSP